MTERLLQVRVRPPRIAVLINEAATETELLLVFEFFSKLWGGRFCQVLPIAGSGMDPLTAYRLGQTRPDFVYGVGLGGTAWSRAVHDACQPRGFGPLRPEFVNGLRQPHREEYFLVDDALVHLFRTRSQVAARTRSVRLVARPPEPKLGIYFAACFGVHHPNLRTDHFSFETSRGHATTAGLLDVAIEFAERGDLSWLGVTMHRLRTQAVSLTRGHQPPTIVLVRSLVRDLSLFWNLRTACGGQEPAWVIPLPADDATEDGVLERLGRWLVAFLRYGARPNFCVVTSESVPEEDCQRFAEELQAALPDSPIKYVDYEPPQSRLPCVVPYEYESLERVALNGRKLSLVPPQPKSFRDIASGAAWFVDLLKDARTGRAAKNLSLPPRQAMAELLNAPCPPNYLQTALPIVGDGVESINLHCNSTREAINIYLPKSDEVIEETLRERDIVPQHDEKRNSYLPAMRRFGGLESTAGALSGVSGRVLLALSADILTPGMIKQRCRLGKGKIPGHYFESVDRIFRNASSLVQRVGRKRFEDYARPQTPESTDLRAMLDFWAGRSVLTRKWRIGPCSRCRRPSFVGRLDLKRPLHCPACGWRIVLGKSVEVGYTLARSVRYAVREGLIPVVLTARFLRNLSVDGFMWLPGVKYRHGIRSGDVDLIASCDGRLVFAECKTRATTPDDRKGEIDWDKTLNQFAELAETAVQCGADLIVLASLVDEYPIEVRRRVETEIDVKVPTLLLARGDLDRGRREVGGGDAGRWLSLYDVLRDPFPEPVRQPRDQPRTIEFGWGRYTH